MQGYALIDTGDGARLERFGDRVTDRPSAVAVDPRRDPDAWQHADLEFSRFHGWVARTGSPEPWQIVHEELTFELRPTESGQVGIFPEQEPMWRWVRDRVEERVQGHIHTPERHGAPEPGSSSERGDDPDPTESSPALPRVLNLFGYTGAATLVAAAAGAHVANVDGSRPAVAWARRNAQLSGLDDRPIRWLVDDADAFVRREERRGSLYDGIILDPPSYGHGKDGRPWRLEERLADLLATCARLRRGRTAFVLLTAHTPGFDAARLTFELADAFNVPQRGVEAGDLELIAQSGARLPLGAFARWPG